MIKKELIKLAEELIGERRPYSLHVNDSADKKAMAYMNIGYNNKREEVQGILDKWGIIKL